MENDFFGTEKIAKILMKMAPPVMLAQLIQALYNVVDSFFVGRYSESGLTALSIIYPIQLLMIALAVGTGVGINTEMAYNLGIGKKKRSDDTAGIGTPLALVMWVLFAGVCFFLMPAYARMNTSSEEVIAMVVSYGRIVCVRSIGLFLESVWTKVHQAEGNMRVPMIAQIVGAVVNIILDPFLIFGLCGLPKMGIAGAALATVLGYTLSMLIALVMILFTKQKVRLQFQGFRIEGKMLGDVFASGLPSFIMNALGSFMVTFVNIFLVAYSDTAVAFFGAYFKVQQLIVMTVNGLIQGCLPIMSFNYGAGKKDRLQQSYRSGRKIATCMMAVGTLLVLVFPNQILALFSASKAMREFGIPAMRIMAIGFIFSGISTMAATYAQATNKLIQSIVIQLLRQAVLLLPVMWVCNLLFHIWGIWIAFPITEIVVMIVSILIVKSDKISR